MQYYKTTSLDLASVLVSEDCELTEIESTENENQFIFCFYQTELVKQLTSDFYSLRLLVSPQKFIQARQNLKTAIVIRKRNKYDI